MYIITECKFQFSNLPKRGLIKSSKKKQGWVVWYGGSTGRRVWGPPHMSSFYVCVSGILLLCKVAHVVGLLLLQLPVIY